MTLALAAFPETAARAREWIDTKVEAATDTVNRVADRLKKAADVILDTVAKAVDIALAVMQASFNAALDIAEFLVLAPFKAMEALADLVRLLAKIGPFLEGVQNAHDNPDAVTDALKASLGGLIAEIPGRAYAVLEEALSNAGATAKRHFDGVWRHLEKGLQHLKAHWWDEIKKLGGNLLWPWPAVGKDLKEIWEQIKIAGSAIWNLDVSAAVDAGLKITQLLNGIAGNFVRLVLHRVGARRNGHRLTRRRSGRNSWFLGRCGVRGISWRSPARDPHRDRDRGDHEVGIRSRGRTQHDEGG